MPDEAYHTGWTYKVNEAGTYAGQACEIGDMVVCVSDFDTTAANADWVVVQRNIDGAVTGPTASTSDNVAVFDGATGKVIADSGITKASVSGAIAKAHEHANKAQLDAITATGAQVNQAVANSHTHANKSALDAIGTDSDGDLTFNGQSPERRNRCGLRGLRRRNARVHRQAADGRRRLYVSGWRLSLEPSNRAGAATPR